MVSNSDDFNQQSIYGQRPTVTQSIYLGEPSKYKLICVGESMVGKTSLIQRFLTNNYSDCNEPTISCDFKTKTVHLSRKNENGHFEPYEQCRLLVWDTAGQERFRQITRMYYKESSGVLICFDLTDHDSFDALNFWLTDLRKNAPVDAIYILCGLKCDLDNNREVMEEDAQAFAKSNQLEYFEISSKEGKNVEEAFMRLAEMLTDRKNQKEEDEKKKQQQIATTSPLTQTVQINQQKPPQNSKRQESASFVVTNKDFVQLQESQDTVKQANRRKCC